MKRKWFASLLALTVLVTMSLGACSKKSSSPTGPSETEDSGPAPTGLDIKKFEASENPVAKSEDISITATVDNPSGTALTYLWSVEDGSVSGSSNVVTWTAPNVNGEYEVKLRVDAANGESTSDSIKIRVGEEYTLKLGLTGGQGSLGCGSTIVDGSADDMDGNVGEVTFGLAWNDLPVEQGYRLQVDFVSGSFGAEDNFDELSANTTSMTTLGGVPDPYTHTYRVRGHLSPGPGILPDDVVSNDCSVTITP